MTHTDDLRERVAEAIHDCTPHGVSWYQQERLGVNRQDADATRSQADAAIAAIYADIAARAMSDEVVEAVAIASYRAGRIQPLPDGLTDTMIRNSDRWRRDKRFCLEEARAGIAALLTALGITESEAE